MSHLPTLIRDLAWILTFASVAAVLFRFLKQPLVLGYILTGVLLGPHITQLPTIIDTENVKTLGELGVIFLLFSLGLEFNFKKLWRMSGSAAVIGIIEVFLMGFIGFGLGRFLHWSQLDSFFLGGILAISSTTIIIKAFEDLGLKSKLFAQTVFAVLIIEDIFAIFIMLFLSTLALSHQFNGQQVSVNLFILFLLCTLWILAGLYIASPALHKIKKWISDEVLIIFSVGLCLLMVLGVTHLGYSAALAAFLTGTFLAETTQREKIKNLLKPVRDLFGAIFFVLIGTLLEPQIMIQYWPLILLITLITVFGKVLVCSLSARISGKNISDSLMIGFSLGQIGEFSFIIASLGLTLGVMSPTLYPITVGVSFLTTLTTPLLIKAAYHYTRGHNSR
jgi:CPA2 family monovalent cation:H+ antiporter-2